MPEDVVQQLIDYATSQVSQVNTDNLNEGQTFLQALNAGVSVAANWAQLGDLIPAAAFTGAEAALAPYAAAVAGMVLLGSAIIGIISAESGGTADSSQALAQFSEQVTDIADSVGANWADITMLSIDNLASTVYTDLQNIADENPQVTPNHKWGPEVLGSYSNYDSDTSKFVNDLFLEPYADAYWMRPYVQSVAFAPQGLRFPQLFPYYANDPLVQNIVWPGWYGSLPDPTPTEDGQVFDPTYVMPAFLYAIQSWLAVHMVLNQIDPNQYTFQAFIQVHGRDFTTQGSHVGYNDYLLGRYQTAVQGLLPTDVPSFADFGGYVSGAYHLDIGGGTLDASGVWTGIYGVVDSYGAYLNNPVAIPSAGLRYIVDWVGAQFKSAQQDYIQNMCTLILKNVDQLPQPTSALLQNVAYPMVATRIRLGLMARWKAVYIMRGYDQVWTFLESLRTMVGQPQDDPMQVSFSDGTTVAASKDWSVRELMSVVNVSPEEPFTASTQGPNGQPVSSVVTPPYQGYSSLYDLATVLDWMASWDFVALATYGGGSPPFRVMVPSRFSNPTGPISLRGRLAAVALNFNAD